MTAERGKAGSQLRCREDRPEAIGFPSHRGFSEFGRQKTVRLDLAGRTPPALQVSDGLDLTSLGSRPELVEGVHAVALVAWHDMTAVRRAWRGRGLAATMKLATIAWAVGHGLTALQTGNDEANAPMRAVNARLGYEPQPDEVAMRGPLIGAMMGG